MSIRHKGRRSTVRNRKTSAFPPRPPKLTSKRSPVIDESVHSDQCTCENCKCKIDPEFVNRYVSQNLYSTSPYRLKKFHCIVDFMLFTIGACYLIMAPFTKVEESFNMQATHDMLFIGVLPKHLESYDHMEFPGVVPRTFIGPLILYCMTWPIKTFVIPVIILLCPLIQMEHQCQYLIRFSLLFLNIFALSKFRQSFVYAHFVQRADIYSDRFQKKERDLDHTDRQRICTIKQFSVLFAVLMTAQFHFLFYCSRLLPNCFALPLVTIAFAEYFRNNFSRALVYLAASTIWFRCDTIVIAVPFILIMLITGYRRYEGHFGSFLKLFIIYGVAGSLVCILCTLLVDSYFWSGFGALRWPEIEMFMFNTVENQSSKWGISPWTFYFYPLVPKMLMVNVLFMGFSILKLHPMIFVHEILYRSTTSDTDDTERRKDPPSLRQMLYWTLDWESVRLLTICVTFVFLYSFLPHKEIRFIFFIIPPCTLLSTIGCLRLISWWGYRNISHSEYSVSWFKQNLLDKQRSLHFVWIPGDSLFASTVRKLTSPSLRVIYEIPRDIIHKLRMHFADMTHCAVPLLIVVGIVTSLVISWYGVYEASYNYPGGVAILVFPKIVSDFKNNITQYQHGVFAKVNGQYYYEDSSANVSMKNATKLRQLKKRKPKVSKISKDTALFEHYDAVNCVHIGNLATTSGVTRFMTPSMDPEYQFSKEEGLEMEDFALVHDPCHFYQEMYAKLCPSESMLSVTDQWRDDIFDEEYEEKLYFQQRDDDFGGEEEHSSSNKTEHDCRSRIKKRFPDIRGFDYIISEHAQVPGYHLLPHGTIYALPGSSSRIRNMLNSFASFIPFVNESEHADFLVPRLYVLKLTTEFDEL